MAVTIHSFFNHYRRHTIAVYMLAQLIGCLLASGLAWLLWQTGMSPLIAFILATLGLMVLSATCGMLVIGYIIQPLRVLSQAIAHVSKDPVITPPPELTNRSYQQSGLTSLVQTVYELSLSSYGQSPVSQAPTTDATFKHVMDAMPCGVIVYGSDHSVHYSNSAAPVTLTSDNVPQVSLLFDQQDNLASWLADCQANKLRDTHNWIRVADRPLGEEGRRIFDVAAYYQKNDNAGVEAIVVTYDRTPAYAPDQDDMDFIALAAHELRGPITVIRGYLDVLINEDVGASHTPQEQLLLDRLQVSAERLSGYVNNILNVSRYDRNQFKVHLQEETLLAIIQNLVPDLALRARTQNRRLTFHIADNIPSVAADRSGISEVLTNLIDNAIKYSHDGGEVVITAILKEATVEVTVADSGIGIPEAVVENLFNKFYRSHRSRQTVSGTGLGLFICKAIVEAHGGNIWVHSTEGRGSTFGFTLPTFASVADKLKDGDNGIDIVERSEGWIKNHAMYRR